MRGGWRNGSRREEKKKINVRNSIMSFTVAEVLQPTVLTRKKNTKTSNRSEQNWLDTKFIQVPVKTKCYRFKI